MRERDLGEIEQIISAGRGDYRELQECALQLWRARKAAEADAARLREAIRKAGPLISTPAQAILDKAIVPPPAPVLSAMPDRETLKRQIAADPDVETEAGRMHPAARAEAGPSEGHAFMLALRNYLNARESGQSWIEAWDEAVRALDRLAGRT